MQVDVRENENISISNDSSSPPAFIRLSEPQPFDINRHLPFIKTQLPEDQLQSLEKALKVDPDLFSHATSNELILDCEAEESFTLETFGNLLKAARSADKDFIIARVTTLDPTGPKPQLYHSHYSAHHINKILFRTQPEEGLLHRMKSRNPLNNMLIVGDVDYFVVRPKDYDAARNRYENLISARLGTDAADQLNNPNSIPKMSLEQENEQKPAELMTDFLLFGLLQRKKSELERDPSASTASIGSPQINVAPFENAKEFTSPNQTMMDLSTTLRSSRNTSNSSLHRSESLNALPSNGEPAILYEAHPFATDDDFLMRSDVREYFKANSVNSDDYLLFTLYRNAAGMDGLTEIPVTGFTSVPIPNSSEIAPPNRRVKSWKNCWGLFYPPSPSISTLRTGIISQAAFKYILLLYIIICILALIFVIPISLSYFIGFGMFVFILFVTIFLVECNPSADQVNSRWNIFTHRQRLQQQREIASTNANISSSHAVGDERESGSNQSALNEV